MPAARTSRPTSGSIPERPKLSWVDRVLLSVAPGFAVRRIHARLAAVAYEAAAGGRRAVGWNRTFADANAAIRPSLAALRELSRDLRRNNGWARRGIQAISHNTIGYGIQPKASHVNARVLAAATATWKTWSDSLACDHDGRLTFTGLQRLVLETVVESGEALIVRQPSNDPRLPVPVCVQVLEPDYLSPLNDGVRTEGGGVIIQGIEFDMHGRRVAYWLYTQHPGSALAGQTVRGAPFATRRVPADQVIHVYQIERPGQVRGVPWLASAIARLNDFDDFEDAQLMQQKVAACFAGFVTDLESAAVATGQVDADDDGLETLEPGHIAYLPAGKQVSFATPPQVTQTTFSTHNLRRIAASLGVTYEDLTGDYSMVNFSSARMARIAHWANVDDWRWNMVIPQFCDGVWQWVMSIAAGLEDWKTTPTVEWTPPPMPMLEPDKEGLAYQRLVRIGALTVPQMIRQLGYDPAAHLQELADSNAELDRLKLVLDCDPRRTNAQGVGQADPLEAGDAGAAEDAGGDGKKDPAASGGDKPRQAQPGNGHFSA